MLSLAKSSLALTELYGIWGNGTGVGDGWVISPDDVIDYSNRAFLLATTGICIQIQTVNMNGYDIRQSGVAQALFVFDCSKSGEITMTSYNADTDTKSGNTYRVNGLSFRKEDQAALLYHNTQH